MLSATNFSFSYPALEQNALSEVSFSLGSGEVLGVIGPNGSGKTTLCMALAGVAPRLTGGQTAGILEVCGLNPQTVAGAEMAKYVGLVFEDYASQITQVEVLDEVMAPLLNRGAAKADAAERARYLLRRVGLGSATYERKRTWELSGGQQQRVAIAAVLALSPPVLLLDNITGMLDLAGKEEVHNLIRELAGETTLLVVENDIDLLVRVSDRLLALVGGQAIAQGPPAELLQRDDVVEQAGIDRPASLRLARALGLPEVPLMVEAFDGLPSARALEARSGSPVPAEPSLGEPLLRFDGVAYRYPDGTAALEGAELTVRESEVHALVGGNGAGKTTMAKLATGILKPTSGQVTVGSKSTHQQTVAQLAQTIGTTFQNPDEQISESTVAEELRFPLRARQYQRVGWFKKRQRYSDAYIQQRIERACELVGLDAAWLERDPIMLSFGQRKLVTLAEALVLDPPVLVLDEPRAGLDGASRQQIGQAIARLQALGKAVVLVEHDIDFVCELANTATLLDRGGIALQGPIRQVFARSNWDLLARLHVRPPRLAQMAQYWQVEALSLEELVAQLALVPEKR